MRSRSGSGPPSTSIRPPRPPSTRIASPCPTSRTVIFVDPSGRWATASPTATSETASAASHDPAGPSPATRAGAASRGRGAWPRRSAARPVRDGARSQSTTCPDDDRGNERRRQAARGDVPRRFERRARERQRGGRLDDADDRPTGGTTPEARAASRRAPEPRAIVASPPPRAIALAAIAGATSGTIARLTIGETIASRPNVTRTTGSVAAWAASETARHSISQPGRRPRAAPVSHAPSGVAQARIPAVARRRQLEAGVGHEVRIDEEEQERGPAERRRGAPRPAALAGHEDHARHRGRADDGRRMPPQTPRTARSRSRSAPPAAAERDRHRGRRRSPRRSRCSSPRSRRRDSPRRS